MPALLACAIVSGSSSVRDRGTWILIASPRLSNSQRERRSAKAGRTTKRTGPETGPMRLGKLSFLTAAGLFNAGLAFLSRRKKVSEPIQDLVGPEPLEPVQ